MPSAADYAIAKPLSKNKPAGTSAWDRATTGSIVDRFDPFGLVHGGSEDEPLSFPHMNKLSPATAYSRYSSAASLADAIGNTGAAARARQHLSGLNYGTPADATSTTFDPNNWMDFNLANTSEAEKGLRRLQRIKFRNAFTRAGRGDLDAAMNRYNVGLQKKIESAQKGALVREIDPTLKEAQDRSTAMMGTAAVSAGDEAAMRSRIATQIKTSEMSRLASVGATLGLGNMSNSPAGAALASRAASSGDQAITSTLRDMGLQVNQINRDDQKNSIELATRIATARYGLLAGNTSSILGMRGDIAQMIDAFYSRDQTNKMNQQAIEAGAQGGSPWAGAAAGAATGAAGGAAVGGIGAIPGAVLGGAAGYFGSR